MSGGVVMGDHPATSAVNKYLCSRGTCLNVFVIGWQRVFHRIAPTIPTGTIGATYMLGCRCDHRMPYLKRTRGAGVKRPRAKSLDRFIRVTAGSLRLSAGTKGVSINEEDAC